MLHREIAAGSLAAGFTACLFSPLECVKTRLQVQDQPGWPRLYCRGFLAALMKIHAEDGIVLLWSHGFFGFVARDLCYSGLRIGLYPTVRAALSGGVDKAEVKLSEKIVAGAFTGAIGAAIANPLDVVRVRMSCEGGVVNAQGRLTTGMRVGEIPRWTTSLHCLRDCAKREGVLVGLWRGVGATVARAALLSSGNLASYDQAKTILVHYGWEDSSRLHAVCAIVSGLVATAMCNPADVRAHRPPPHPLLPAPARCTSVAGWLR